MAQDPLARKRPFVPLKPEDIRLGNFIKFSRPGGKISKGSVKYMGPLPERSDMYFGLELDSEGYIFINFSLILNTNLLNINYFQFDYLEGKHDGIYQDKRYFQT